MRLLFVNHAHPDLPHVSGMRLGNFARAMAARGHQVVLLTATLPDDRDGMRNGPMLSTRLREHDWREPLVVAVLPHKRRSLDWIRSDRLPTPLRRAMSLYQFVAHGGTFADWSAPALRIAKQLAGEYRPQLVWGTFGNTSTLVVARTAARHAHCPWLMDIKDSWPAFVPKGLRGWMARRFRDAAGWTSNAKAHERIASHWLGYGPSHVLYSGVADAFFTAAACSATRHDLVLIGGTYSGHRLATFLDAVGDWLASLHDEHRASFRFVYAGSDAQAVEQALRARALPCRIDVRSYLPLPELAELVRSSLANCYLVSAGSFHHKLLELLSAGRPVLCHPGESDESMRLMQQTDTIFYSCDNAEDIHAALQRLWRSRDAQPALTKPVPAWRWDDFAGDLELFFEMALQKEPG